MVGAGCVDGGGLQHFCCKCVPARACVKLWDINNPYTPIAAVESVFLCGPNIYRGSISCGGRYAIDFEIGFYKDDYGDCYIYLASNTLGHFLGPEDTRIFLPMGGEYHDNEVKKRDCRGMNFEWEVDLTPAYCTGVQIGRITIEPAPYTSVPVRPSCGPGSCPETCVCEIGCITIVDLDEYGLLRERKRTTCLVQEGYETYWKAELENDEWVKIEIETENPLTFRLTTSSSFPDPIEPVQRVCCSEDYNEEPTGCRMTAKWDKWDDPYADLISVRISGDGFSNSCTDCPCFCEYLCITYGTILGSESKIVPFNHYTNGWLADFSDASFSINMICDGCPSGRTKLELDSPYRIISTNPQSIVCPNLLNATWSFIKDEQTFDTGFIIVECVTCDEKCGTYRTDCCPGVDIPRTLFATLESIYGCDNLDGVQIPIIHGSGNNEWSGRVTTPGPENIGPCVTSLGLVCLADGWKLTDGQGLVIASATKVTCDPFEIEFSPNEPGVLAGCCEGIRPFAILGVRITK
jgi:hypothetical protein